MFKACAVKTGDEDKCEEIVPAHQPAFQRSRISLLQTFGTHRPRVAVKKVSKQEDKARLNSFAHARMQRRGLTYAVKRPKVEKPEDHEGGTTQVTSTLRGLQLKRMLSDDNTLRRQHAHAGCASKPHPRDGNNIAACLIYGACHNFLPIWNRIQQNVELDTQNHK